MLEHTHCNITGIVVTLGLNVKMMIGRKKMLGWNLKGIEVDENKEELEREESRRKFQTKGKI
jgi:hypothetical protein